MNLRTATIPQLRKEYNRLRKLITTSPDFIKIVKQRKKIVKEIRSRNLNPHSTIT